MAASSNALVFRARTQVWRCRLAEPDFFRTIPRFIKTTQACKHGQLPRTFINRCSVCHYFCLHVFRLCDQFSCSMLLKNNTILSDQIGEPALCPRLSNDTSADTPRSYRSSKETRDLAPPLPTSAGLPLVLYHLYSSATLTSGVGFYAQSLFLSLRCGQHLGIASFHGQIATSAYIIRSMLLRP